jgi:hypothetical protein
VVWVSAIVTANVGVAKVELCVDGKLTSKSTSSPFAIRWNLNKAAGGQHDLRVKACDSAGNSGISKSVTVFK